MRRGIPVLSTCLLATVLYACGGGGGGGGGSAGAVDTPTRRPGTPVGGGTPPPADTPTATPTPIRPGTDLLEAIRNAPAGSTLIVSPGSYAALEIHSADLQGPITLVADATGGTETIGGVTIFAGQAIAAVQLIGVEGVTLDGFTLQGGSEEGLLVLDSPQTTVRNCIVRLSKGDGIFVEGSNDALLFDNLIRNNTAVGIRIFGSAGVEVSNNTLYKNGASALSIGSQSEPATGVVVENNIIDSNAGVGISVHATTTDYTGNFNLNTDGYGADTPVGANDLTGPSANPLFAAPDSGDFRLVQQDDACTGGSPAVNAGDPETPSDFVSILIQRSTSPDGTPDCVGSESHCCVGPPPNPLEPGPDLGPGQVDLGYHYPLALATPTPSPRRTNTRPPGTAGTPAGGTPTRTPTRPTVPTVPAGTATPTNTQRGPIHSPTRTPRV